ncbi:class I SAM-dependent methyltransferase [Gracilimonas sp.]|uniref:class I SAM-dependent methyltransferase n=1 Tax=Gracilimonas sp. TaxID=1974203 RepID=UPI002872903B|nr:class I SAM-dependent methyltransferase [Gracilimonas sp.]
MSLIFPDRQAHLIEEMDRDDCEPVTLQNTYRQFSTINKLLSKWKNIYKQQIRPLLKKGESYSLLDIGFGGGDLSIHLARWAQEDGIELNITAIDTDERAYDYATETYPSDLVDWKHLSSSELVAQNKSFDFVISNHLLHHLDNESLADLLHEATQLATKKVIFNDIERNGLGYLLFNIFSRLLFRNSYITKDGLISIKRSFTHRELEALVPKGWQVYRVFPFRLVLSYEKD